MHFDPLYSVPFQYKICFEIYYECDSFMSQILFQSTNFLGEFCNGKQMHWSNLENSVAKG